MPFFRNLGRFAWNYGKAQLATSLLRTPVGHSFAQGAQAITTAAGLFRNGQGMTTPMSMGSGIIPSNVFGSSDTTFSLSRVPTNLRVGDAKTVEELDKKVVTSFNSLYKVLRQHNIAIERRFSEHGRQIHAVRTHVDNIVRHQRQIDHFLNRLQFEQQRLSNDIHTQQQQQQRSPFQEGFKGREERDADQLGGMLDLLLPFLMGGGMAGALGAGGLTGLGAYGAYRGLRAGARGLGRGAAALGGILGRQTRRLGRGASSLLGRGAARGVRGFLGRRAAQRSGAAALGRLGGTAGGRALGRLGTRGALGMAGRLGARALPWIGWGMLGYDAFSVGKRMWGGQGFGDALSGHFLGDPTAEDQEQPADITTSGNLGEHEKDPQLRFEKLTIISRSDVIFNVQDRFKVKTKTLDLEFEKLKLSDSAKRELKRALDLLGKGPRKGASSQLSDEEFSRGSILGQGRKGTGNLEGEALNQFLRGGHGAPGLPESGLPQRDPSEYGQSQFGGRGALGPIEGRPGVGSSGVPSTQHRPNKGSLSRPPQRELGPSFQFDGSIPSERRLNKGAFSIPRREVGPPFSFDGQIPVRPNKGSLTPPREVGPPFSFRGQIPVRPNKGALTPPREVGPPFSFRGQIPVRPNKGSSTPPPQEAPNQPQGWGDWFRNLNPFRGSSATPTAIPTLVDTSDRTKTQNLLQHQTPKFAADSPARDAIPSFARGVVGGGFGGRSTVSGKLGTEAFQPFGGRTEDLGASQFDRSRGRQGGVGNIDRSPQGGGGPPSRQPQTPSQSANPYLADRRREKFEQELQDPTTRDMVMRMLRAEGGGSDTLEALMNRADMRGTSLRQQLTNGYYGPINRRSPSFTRSLSDRDRSRGEDAIRRAMEGSNRIQFRQEQGLPTDPGARAAQREGGDRRGWIRPDPRGNVFLFEGRQGRRGRTWAEQRQREAEEHRRQNPDRWQQQPQGQPQTQPQTPWNGQLGANPDQEGRPGHMTGTMSFGDRTFPFGSGSGRNARYPSIPYGTYQIPGEHRGRTVPRGWKIEDSTIDQRIDDPKLGRQRTAIVIHPSGNRALASHGCVVLESGNYQEFDRMMREMRANGGRPMMSVTRDGIRIWDGNNPQDQGVAQVSPEAATEAQRRATTSGVQQTTPNQAPPKRQEQSSGGQGEGQQQPSDQMRRMGDAVRRHREGGAVAQTSPTSPIGGEAGRYIGGQTIMDRFRQHADPSEKPLLQRWLNETPGDPSTAIHESVHLLSKERLGGYLLPDGTHARRIEADPEFGTSRYLPTPKSVLGNYPRIQGMTDTYLTGRNAASSATDFGFWLDEQNAYTHENFANRENPKSQVNFTGTMMFSAGTADYIGSLTPQQRQRLTTEHGDTIRRIWGHTEQGMAYGATRFGSDQTEFFQGRLNNPRNQRAMEEVLGRPMRIPERFSDADPGVVGGVVGVESSRRARPHQHSHGEHGHGHGGAQVTRSLGGRVAQVQPQGQRQAGAGPMGGAWGPRLMTDLQRDFGLQRHQAAGIVGNFHTETGGFRQIQEQGMRRGRGGLGIAQWTGPRRRQFEAWAQERGLATNSYEANYGFLQHELRNTEERRVIGRLRGAENASQASQIFMNTFERPGVPHADRRAAAANRFARGGDEQQVAGAEQPRQPGRGRTEDRSSDAGRAPDPVQVRPSRRPQRGRQEPPTDDTPPGQQRRPQRVKGKNEHQQTPDAQPRRASSGRRRSRPTTRSDSGTPKPERTTVQNVAPRPRRERTGTRRAAPTGAGAADRGQSAGGGEDMGSIASALGGLFGAGRGGSGGSGDGQRSSMNCPVHSPEEELSPIMSGWGQHSNRGRSF